MKLKDLRKKAQEGSIAPDDLGTCDMEECPHSATHVDEEGSWCMFHRERTIRKSLGGPEREPMSLGPFTGATVASYATVAFVPHGPVKPKK